MSDLTMSLLQFTKKRILFLLILMVIALCATIGLVLLNLGKVVNSNKDRILAKAEEILGRKVTVEKIDVTLWTGVGVHLTQFAIADDPKISNENFVSTETLDIYFQLLPLFRKELEISHLTLQKPVIKIVKTKEGKYNFSSLLTQNPGSQSESTSPSTTNPSSQSTTIFLSNLEIEDGQIDYIDQKSQQDLQWSHVKTTIRDFTLDKPFPLKFDAAFLGEKQNLSFNGQAGPLAASQQKLALNGDLTFHDLPLKSLAQLPMVKSSLPSSLQSDGTIQGKIHLEGAMDSLLVNAELDGTNSIFTYNQQYEKPKGLPLQLSMQSKVSSTEIDLQKIEGKMNVLAVEGKGKIGLGKTPSYQISMQSKPIDLVSLIRLAPQYKMYNPAGNVAFQVTLQSGGKAPSVQGTLDLNKIKVDVPSLPKPISDLTGKIQFDLSKAKTEGLTLLIGQSKLDVEADIQQFAPLTGKYSIVSTRLAIDDLMVPSEAMKNDALEAVKISGSFDQKKAIHSSGEMSSPKGTFYGLAYTALKSPYEYTDNILSLSALSLQTLNGQVEGKAQYDMQKVPPQFEISTQIKSIDLAELARTKIGWLAQFVQGKINLDMDVSGSGTSWDTIKSTLQGNGKANIVDGMLLNVNLADSLLNSIFKMPQLTNFVATQYKDEYPTVFASEHTIFQDLNWSTTIEDGKLNFKNILITAADWAVNGDGWMNFDQKLDSNGLLRFSKGFTSFMTGKVDLLKYLSDENGNLSIPFSMTGTMPTLKPAPNSDFVGGIFQKALAGKITEKLNLKGIPGIPNILPLPFDLNAKSQNTSEKTLPIIPSDAATSTSTATPETSAPQAVLPATPEVSQPTKITPKDVLNPFLNLLKKK